MAAVCLLAPLAHAQDAEPAPVAPWTDAQRARIEAYRQKLQRSVDEVYTEQRQNLDQARAWLEEEIEKQGDWEYQVVDVSQKDEAQLPARLNEAGAEGWECFQVVPTKTGWKLFCKRPTPTSLDQIPTEELMRLLPLLLMNQ
ncbi:MAG: hypothetical protein Q7P63_05395 [Verrucomicrobiota bacterium JB022]|nr:hypothetical protein [Verrucomicrobiota bacterium JB022]